MFINYSMVFLLIIHSVELRNFDVDLQNKRFNWRHVQGVYIKKNENIYYCLEI